MSQNINLGCYWSANYCMYVYTYSATLAWAATCSSPAQRSVQPGRPPGRPAPSAAAPRH